MPNPNPESFCDKLNMQHSEPVSSSAACAKGCAIPHAQHDMEGSIEAARSSQDKQESGFESMLYEDPDLPDDVKDLIFRVPRRKEIIHRDIYF